jgi:hypothetical protein
MLLIIRINIIMKIDKRVDSMKIFICADQGQTYDF